MFVTIGSCVYIVDCVLGKKKKYIQLTDETTEPNLETSVEGLASLATISAKIQSVNFFHFILKLKLKYFSSRFDCEKYEQILKKIYDEVNSVPDCPLNSASASNSIDFDSLEVRRRRVSPAKYLEEDFFDFNELDLGTFGDISRVSHSYFHHK